MQRGANSQGNGQNDDDRDQCDAAGDRRPVDEVVAENVVEYRGVNLDAGKHGVERGVPYVANADGGDPEEHQDVAEDPRVDAPSQHVRGGHVKEGALQTAVVDQQLPPTIDRQRLGAEPQPFNPHGPEADGGAALRPRASENRQRERHNNAIAETDGQGNTPEQAIGVGEEIEVPEPGGGRRQRWEILRHPMPPLQWPAVGAGCLLYGRVRAFAAIGAVAVAAGKVEEVAKHGATGALHRLDQERILALCPAERAGHFRPALGADEGIGQSLDVAGVRGLGLHQIDADGRRIAGVDALDELRHAGARPRPAAELG